MKYQVVPLQVFKFIVSVLELTATHRIQLLFSVLDSVCINKNVRSLVEYKTPNPVTFELDLEAVGRTALKMCYEVSNFHTI